MKKVLYGFILLSVLFVMSCSNGSEIKESSVKHDTAWEMSVLASETELDNLASRGDDNIVDWQLSKEFADLWLAGGIEEGDYPEGSALWDIPIAVYDTDGNIKFYEFRVVSGKNVVGAIVGAATKNYGCPVTYQTISDGYADKLTELYNSGALNKESIPRIVDDGYPSIVVGVASENRGESVSFNSFVDINSGKTVEKDDVATVLSYDDVEKNYKEYTDADENEKQKMQALIENYNKDGTTFWETAEAHKGNIANFANRGSSKRERTSLSSGKLDNYFGTSRNSIVNYGACGPVAAGFVLDYLDANGENLNAWRSLSQNQKKNELYSRMHVFQCRGGEATWPLDLGNAIKDYSNYQVIRSLFNYPKDSINNDIPGISLRVFGSGFAHYRPVIAYENKGWWIFSWPTFKILDLVDCTDKMHGSWETYIPYYHFANYNVVRK